MSLSRWQRLAWQRMTRAAKRVHPASRRPGRAPLAVEWLESRVAPTVSAYLDAAHRAVSFLYDFNHQPDVSKVDVHLRTDATGLLQWSEDGTDSTWSSDLDPAPGPQTLLLTGASGDTTINVSVPGGAYLGNITGGSGALTITYAGTGGL
jgi:hypothetical protein